MSNGAGHISANFDGFFPCSSINDKVSTFMISLWKVNHGWFTFKKYHIYIILLPRVFFHLSPFGVHALIYSFQSL